MSWDIVIKYLTYAIEKDYIKDYLLKIGDTRFYKIDEHGIIYSVTNRISEQTLEDMETLFKRPFRYYEAGFNRYVKAYSHNIYKPSFTYTNGLYIGQTLEDILSLPIDTEQNNYLIVGTSGSGKSNITLNAIKSAIHNNIEVVICDNKNSKDYDSFKGSAKLYKSIEQCVSVIHSTIEECERRSIEDTCFKPKLLVIDEVFPFLTLKDKKDIYNTLALLLSRCRSVNIHVWIATQRATTEIIPSIITANISHRICLQTASEQESINVLQCGKAYRLDSVGEGYYRYNSKLIRFKAPKFTKPKEVSETKEITESIPSTTKYKIVPSSDSLHKIVESTYIIDKE